MRNTQQHQIDTPPKRHQPMLVGKRRSAESNKHLGWVLAFIAGAINAGGFMIVSQYTSHMTGMVSRAIDSIALGAWHAGIAMLFYIVCFIVGATTTSTLVIWGKTLHLHSQYALPLVLESILLIIFGAIYSLHDSPTLINPSYIIAFLCYLMGLQNAVITRISNTTIRTTHITGMVTDIGIELGNILFAKKHQIAQSKEKLSLHLSIVSMFLVGGTLGAYSFKYVGFMSVLPLAACLLFIALRPLKRDITITKYMLRRH